MTLEELLDASAGDLEKLTLKELTEFFEPFFKVTRPELADKPVKNGPRTLSSRMTSSKQRKFDMAAQMAKQLGIDLDFE